MTKVVGLPRALIHYKYGVLWKTFFEKVGAKVIESPKTTKEIRELGLQSAPDEDCYSTKLYFGHALSIADKVDYLFIPRYGSNHPINIGCPKFIGLADVLRSMFPNLPEILRPYYSKAKGGHTNFRLLRIAFKLGFRFTKNPFKILNAFIKAIKAYKQYKKKLIIDQETLKNWEEAKCYLNEKPDIPKGQEELKIALVGHSYVINDPYASLDIREKLHKFGVNYITSEQMPRKLIEKQMDKLDFNMYFEYEREILGTIMHYLENPSIDGIIHLIIFSCGPDSIAGELASRYARRQKSTPLLQLVLDELTAEAGFQTRIEAFIDMLRRRKKKHAIHLPTLRVS
ncbi:MAG: acyl-CoA dehydratase activase-related protein [Asgard group archaeon]|nr:acyl-CoA dehydratase activase-related protein [Asgard group archaeon]